MREVKINQILNDFNCELYDIEENENTITIFVFKNGENINLDEIIFITPKIIEYFEAEGNLDHKNIEISSPGLTRKLIKPDNFIKSLNHEITFKLNGDVMNGLLISANNENFEIILKNQKIKLKYNAVEDVKLKFTSFKGEKNE